WYVDGGRELLQAMDAGEPLLKARTRACKGRLRTHGEVPGKQNSVGLDPDNRVADGMVRAHRCQFRPYAAEIEFVVALEGDVGLAEIRVLEQFGMDRGPAGEDLGEPQAGLGDVLLLIRRADPLRRALTGLGAAIMLGMDVS